MSRPARILSVAGSDPSGGAGIQADLKTVAALGGYGMAAVTALTAQSPLGVRGVFPVPASFVAEQVETLLRDCPPDAVKVGMLGTAEVARVVGSALAGFAGPVVLDPVLVATSGDALAGEGVVAAVQELLPVASLLTPNLSEAGVLLGRPAPATRREMVAAGRALVTLGSRAVLVKGGHLADDVAADVLVRGEEAVWFEAVPVATANTHGTGCTLSSAVACLWGSGMALPDAVAQAKRYLTCAIAAADGLGGWGAGAHGPVHHGWCLETRSQGR